MTPSLVGFLLTCLKWNLNVKEVMETHKLKKKTLQKRLHSHEVFFPDDSEKQNQNGNTFLKFKSHDLCKWIRHISEKRALRMSYQQRRNYSEKKTPRFNGVISLRGFNLLIIFLFCSELQWKPGYCLFSPNTSPGHVLFFVYWLHHFGLLCAMFFYSFFFPFFFTLTMLLVARLELVSSLVNLTTVQILFWRSRFFSYSW